MINNINFISSNCIGCNNCLRNCPSKEANISYSDCEGNLKVRINQDKCIKCGKCIKSCEHHARIYEDDFSQLLSDLQIGETVSLIVTPSVQTILKEKYRDVLQWLRNMGISKIYHSSIGEDICTWAHVEYIHKNPGKKIITQNCNSTLNYIEKYRPELHSLISPIQSPLMCTSTYIRKYKNIKSKIAVISPCVASKPGYEQVPGSVDYDITVSSIIEYLNNSTIELPESPNFIFDGDEEILGGLFYSSGNLCENLKMIFGNNISTLRCDGNENVFEKLDIYSNQKEDNLPDVFHASSCNGGCNFGPGSGAKQNIFEVGRYLNKIKTDCNGKTVMYLTYPKRHEYMSSLLKYEDFVLKYNFKSSVPIKTDPIKVDDAFKILGKFTETQKNRNCQGCGYGTCQNLAIAIAKGLATSGSCIHKLKLDAEESGKSLERIAYYDNLTGAPNKTFFKLRSKAILTDSSNKYAYIIFNIRRFKIFNENFGYNNGDLLLKHIAKIISEKIYENEIFGRFSGDNFHILVEYINDTQLIKRLNSIEYKIRSFHMSENSNYSIGCEFGVYIISDKKMPIDNMGNKASIALNQTLEMHDGTIYFYDDVLRNKIFEEQEIENKMEQALANNDFKIFLQPKYSVSENKIIGAEALARWQIDEHEYLSPDKFIDVFERNGFITKLDMYMLENVCKWLRMRIDTQQSVVPISVNQSKMHLYSKDYIWNIIEILRKYSIPTSLIELEVTESMFFEDSKTMIYIINRLHNLGFKISMDDFGIGYSSLSMLNQISVDVLKLDRRFFQDSANSKKGKTIIDKIISMADSINITTVAEGVEFSEHVDFLKTTKCDVVQGFFFSKPVPVNNFENLIDHFDASSDDYNANQCS